MIKDARRSRNCRNAIDATQRGFEDVIRALPTAPTERHVEGVFNLRARVDGNDVGYGTIAASGAHACTLHWTANDGVLRPSELLLLDAGVEAHTLYTADITRTIPIGGRFSPEQREIYALVLAAQDAGFAACRPGNDFLDPNRAAMDVLAARTRTARHLTGCAARRWPTPINSTSGTRCTTSATCWGSTSTIARRRARETYKFGKLAAGMVLTVEPGLYFQPDDLTVPERYRGIGVRIEDDVVITADGCRVLSAGLPRQTDAVEAWMRDLWDRR